MTTPTNLPHDSWLDLDDWIGQRMATFRFEAVVGGSNSLLRELTPLYTATLRHSAGATINRQLQVQFAEEDTASINVLTDRVRVYMQLRGTDWPLGRYMFSDQTRYVHSSGDRSDAILMDEMLLVDQKIDQTFAPPPPTPIPDALHMLLDPLPITTIIESSPYSTVGVWPLGTRRGQVTEDLALDGDYYSPWFDNTGTMRFKRTTDVAASIPDFDFDVGNKVLRASISETDDALQAPNRFIVISNAAEAQAAPIVGVYDIPSSAPHSIANRGFVIAEVVERQLETQAQADAVAQALGERQTLFETVVLDTAPDPRHDGYNVVRWQGVNWLEIGWEMRLKEGEPMRHTLRRAYTP